MNFFLTFLYNIGIQFYYSGIVISRLWNKKAQQWLQGRKNQFQKIEVVVKENEHHVWFHCASVGEFEQGRPLIEAYRKQWPQHKIVLTFFSPSGFELRKNYTGADYIFYLPLDTVSNAKKFIKLVQPNLAIFVKYEFWYHHLNILKQQHIPAILVSGVFRKNQLFFRWFGKPWKNVLSFFQHLFLQDQTSLQLLQSINIHNASVTGDTRFDRVWQIAQQPKELSLIESFKYNQKLFVAGSTWPEDEAMMTELIKNENASWKWIIVPHELNANHLKELKNRFREEAILYSAATADTLIEKRILIVDEVGFLSSIYSYADIAYVGGGFGKGIHNILEAAVYGIPVLFGPNYQRFNEAKELIALGAVRSVNTPDELNEAFQYFTTQPDSVGKINRNYVEHKKGATEKIMQHLKQINSGTASSPV